MDNIFKLLEEYKIKTKRAISSSDFVINKSKFGVDYALQKELNEN